MKRTILILLLCLCSSLALAAEPVVFTKIVAFGDSLSDHGNDFHESQVIHSLDHASPLFPAAPYQDENFSNGLVWVQYLQEDLYALNPKVDVSLLDYARGGAWAEWRYDIDNGKRPMAGIMNLPWQVSMYLNRVTHDDPNHTLYTVWIGGNDYLTGRKASGESAAFVINAATTQTVNQIIVQLKKLIKSGAKYIVVPNLPDVSKAPWARFDKNLSKPGFVSDLANLTIEHNDKLQIALAKLQKQNPQAHIMFFNIHALFNKVITNKNLDGFTFKNVSDPCFPCMLSMKCDVAAKTFKPIKASISSDQAILSLNPQQSLTAIKPSHTVCKNPNDHLFWDLVHPTTKAHELIAREAVKLLQKDLGENLQQ
tara:strand:- start:1792 stop:2895 length:1104 start_codon:yes stop_codon:yes gene_type:complete